MQSHGLTHIISPNIYFDFITDIIRLDPITLYQQAHQPAL